MDKKIEYGMAWSKLISTCYIGEAQFPHFVMKMEN